MSQQALVTGSSGFVGRHVAARLEADGYQVSRCDILDGLDALDVFTYDDASYDLVVHAAAVAPHRAAIDGVPQNLMHNVILDSNMFRWALKTRPGRVIYLSSSAAYPVPYQRTLEDGHDLHEDFLDLDGPQFPDSAYGWTKVTGEKMALAARAAGLDVTVVRPFSGYGEDQGEDWPFGAFVRRAMRREDPFDIWGPGTQVRDWIHIEDVVSGMLGAAASGTTEPVNLCTGRGVSMLELSKMVCEAVDFEPEFRTYPDKPTGVMYRVGDPERMKQFHVPEISLEEGVARAVTRASVTPAPF